MKSSIIKPFGTALSAIVLLFALNSCETWRQDCAGQIIVENEIPDIILYVGGESFYRDIFEPPIVLRHTDNQLISIIVMPNDGTIVSAGRKLNTETQRASIVKVVPLKEGKTEVKIFASDNCVESEFSTGFAVTVIDTTLN